MNALVPWKTQLLICLIAAIVVYAWGASLSLWPWPF